MFYGMSADEITNFTYLMCGIGVVICVALLVWMGVRARNQRKAWELEDERFYRANAELAKTDPQTAAIDRQTYEIKKHTRQQTANSQAIASSIWFSNSFNGNRR